MSTHPDGVPGSRLRIQPRISFEPPDPFRTAEIRSHGTDPGASVHPMTVASLTSPWSGASTVPSHCEFVEGRAKIAMASVARVGRHQCRVATGAMVAVGGAVG